MGIKTPNYLSSCYILALKNLPTTWGLRHSAITIVCSKSISEKPPHHMGIKTQNSTGIFADRTLKNLPTTWGLRLLGVQCTF